MQIFKKKLAPTLRNMEISEKVEYDLSRLTSVRVTCNRIGLEMDRTYSMRSDREKRVITVERTR